MLPFKKKDAIFVLILGELVGLFGYAIIREQAAAEGAGTLVRGLAMHPATLPVLMLGVPLAALAALVLTYLLGKRFNPSLYQFGKFAAVGASNTAIDFGVLNLLLTPLGLATGSFAIGKFISAAVATLNSFLWNKFWSFEKKGKEHIGREALQFYVVTGLGLLFNVAIATGVKVIGPETEAWAGLVAPAVATATMALWNFFGYKFIVFGKKNEPGGQKPPKTDVPPIQ